MRAPGQQKRRFIGRTWRAIGSNLNPNYLIKGVLPRDGLAVVWGAKKSGKSFWVFDLIMHIVTGRDYRGRQVRQGSVVYIALEGSSGFDNRVDAWRQSYCTESDDDLPFLLINERLNLAEDYRELIAAVQAQLPDVVLILIDTLNRALLGDENNSLDMGRFIRAADSLGTAFGCLVLLIHHCGVAGSRPRGHTSLSGADDVSIAVVRDDKSKVIRCTVEHAKDFEAGACFASKLEGVQLGTDDDGDPVTSCVIAPCATDDSGKPIKLSENEQLAYDALKRTIKDKGTEVQAGSAMAESGVPVGQHVCKSEDWRTCFYDLHEGKPAAKKKALFRATLALEEHKLITLAGTYVWLA